MSLYWVKKVKGRKKKVWNWGRSRGIDDSKERVGGIMPEIKGLLKNKRKIRVLEIGCGYGRALLELKREFGDKVETYGINKEERWTQDLVRKFGLAEKIFTKDEIDHNLPEIYILDAGEKLPLKSNYFDFIYSWASMQYVKDKAFLLEEANRLLTRQGIAKIEIQDHKLDNKSKIPPEYQCLLEIWDNGRKIEFSRYVRRFNNIKVRKSEFRPWHYVVMRKASRFDLGLKLVETVNLEAINPGKWWGMKAIYIRK